MTYKKFIKILALLAVIAFIFTCIVIYFKPVSPTNTFDLQTTTSKTFSNFETSSTDDWVSTVSKSTTKYYDENGSVKYILNTTIDFRSTIVDENTLRSYCKCSAEYNNQIATYIFQNDTTVTNIELTSDFAQKVIDEPVKQCSNDCIKYGAEHFFGIK